MATETHRRRFESDWHGDGLNVQPEGSERSGSVYEGSLATIWHNGKGAQGTGFADFSEFRKKTYAII